MAQGEFVPNSALLPPQAVAAVTLGQPHTSSPTLGAGTAGLRAMFLEEEPLELAGDV